MKKEIDESEEVKSVVDVATFEAPFTLNSSLIHDRFTPAAVGAKTLMREKR